MTCNKGGGRCCKAKRHLDFFGRQPVSRGKFPGRKSRKGITVQKSITQFLGCYKPSPLKGILSSRFVGVAQTTPTPSQKFLGWGKRCTGASRPRHGYRGIASTARG